MTKVDVKNTMNKVVGTLDVQDDLVQAEVNAPLIHEVVLMQLACRRAGTHMTKTKGLVSGGGVKPWKQKGTGRARSGSNRSPLWKGGGTIFGPQPRDYSYTMPKKKVKLALKSIMSAKFSDKSLCFIDTLEVKEGKTKEAVAILKALEADRNVLFVVDNSVDEKVYRAFSNVPYADILHVNGLNVYSLVTARKIFILSSCLETIQNNLTISKKTA